MQEGDLTAVMEIERGAFTVPWTPATFRGLLRRPDTVVLVAEVPGDVVGYAATWMVVDQAELGDIAVAEPYRGRGIGQRLLDEVLVVVAQRGIKELFLEVRVSNTRARRLYERNGFTLVGQRPAYYSKPREDALVLRRVVESAD